MLHVISARCIARDLHTVAHVCAQGHLSVRVGDGSRRSEEIVKNLKLRLIFIVYYYYCLLVALRPSDMLVYLRDGAVEKTVCAATLR